MLFGIFALLASSHKPVSRLQYLLARPCAFSDRPPGLLQLFFDFVDVHFLDNVPATQKSVTPHVVSYLMSSTTGALDSLTNRQTSAREMPY